MEVNANEDWTRGPIDSRLAWPVRTSCSTEHRKNSVNRKKEKPKDEEKELKLPVDFKSAAEAARKKEEQKVESLMG